MSWPELPPERPGRPAAAGLEERRQVADGRSAGPEDARPGTTSVDRRIGGVDCVVVTPERPRATMLYCHGGGYRLGRARSWTGFATRVAYAASCEVVVVDYRLAPEHPFPAALRDVAAVHDALPADASPLLVAGDSAGGGLATALVAAAIAGGHPVAEGLVLLSPWVDLTVTSETYTSRASTDQFFPLESAEEAAEAYLQGVEPRQPLASPLFADLTDFPPSLVFAGGAETLLGDSLRLVSRLAELGASVEAHVATGMQHVWPTLFPELPESVEALQAVVRFVDRVVGDMAETATSGGRAP